jgi:putative methionine-R-sulfoxide reductase with GAF domain
LHRTFVPHGRLNDPIANMTNCAALIFNSLPPLNWAGFYLLKDGELVFGASGLALRVSHYFARPSLKKILA